MHELRLKESHFISVPQRHQGKNIKCFQRKVRLRCTGKFHPVHWWQTLLSRLRSEDLPETRLEGDLIYAQNGDILAISMNHKISF